MTQAEISPTVSDRSTEFVPVQGGQETSDAGSLLVVAYILMWCAVFTFVWLTSRRLSAMRGRMEEVENALKKADAASRTGP